MKSELKSRRLQALPVQVIETDTGVILRRGCTELLFEGRGASDVLRRIWQETTSSSASLQEICEKFPAPHHPHIQKVVENLIAKRFLVMADANESQLDIQECESSLDIFYWNFGDSSKKATARFNEQHIAIIGVNCISRQLVRSLTECGATNFEIIDDPLLRNLRLFDEESLLMDGQWPSSHAPKNFEAWPSLLEAKSPFTCLVATSDFGGYEILRNWNRRCIEQKRHYLPVVLDGVTGYVGPLVIPGETACLECLYVRQNSHMRDVSVHRASERMAFEGQVVNGFHPSMPSITADFAALELTKFYSDVIPTWHIGTLIEINLLAPQLITRRVLKIPRCKVCSSMVNQPSMMAKIPPTQTEKT